MSADNPTSEHVAAGLGGRVTWHRNFALARFNEEPKAAEFTEWLLARGYAVISTGASMCVAYAAPKVCEAAAFFTRSAA